MNIRNAWRIALIPLVLVAMMQSSGAASVSYRSVEVSGLDIFYREAGSPDAPTILLLHGFPTSSHMFRNLMRELSDSYHLLAPDFPGFGNSDQPSMEDYDYTFDNLPAGDLAHGADTIGQSPIGLSAAPS